MNLASWNRLSNAEKKIIADEARKVELSWPRGLREADRGGREGPGRQGMQIARMGEARKAKLKVAWSEARGGLLTYPVSIVIVH